MQHQVGPGRLRQLLRPQPDARRGGFFVWWREGALMPADAPRASARRARRRRPRRRGRRALARTRRHRARAARRARAPPPRGAQSPRGVGRARHARVGEPSLAPPATARRACSTPSRPAATARALAGTRRAPTDARQAARRAGSRSPTRDGGHGARGASPSAISPTCVVWRVVHIPPSAPDAYRPRRGPHGPTTQAAQRAPGAATRTHNNKHIEDLPCAPEFERLVLC